MFFIKFTKCFPLQRQVLRNLSSAQGVKVPFIQFTYLLLCIDKISSRCLICTRAKMPSTQFTLCFLVKTKISEKSLISPCAKCHQQCSCLCLLVNTRISNTSLISLCVKCHQCTFFSINLVSFP